VRDRNRASQLAAESAEIVEADLDSNDLEKLERAHVGIDFVVLQFPAGNDGPSRRQQGVRAIKCIRQTTSIKGIIFNASVQYPKHLEELPAFSATKEIEETLRDGTIPFSVVHPTFYLQNLLLPWAVHSIATQNMLAYPVAEGQPLAWVAAEDIARLIDHLLLHNSMGVSVHVGGQRAINGPELAKCFSEGLDRLIRYHSLNLDEFQHRLDQVLGPGVGARISGIFRFIERNPDDIEFVSKPCVQPAQVPSFESTDVTRWVAAHRADFNGRRRV
jgi:uncharacterized protein YbjT (DUF2867 family)